MQGWSAATEQRATRPHSGMQEVRPRLRGYVGRLLLRVGVVSSIPFSVYLGYRAWHRGVVWLTGLHLLSLAILLLVAFWRGVGHHVQSGALLMFVYGLALVVDLRGEGMGQGKVVLVAGTVLATLLLGRKAGLISLLIGFGLLVVGGKPWIEGRVLYSTWARDVLILGVVGGALTFAVDYVATGLVTGVGEIERRVAWLEAQHDALLREREQLERRGTLLKRRIEGLHTATGVALDIRPGLEEKELLDRAARLTSERFGFFHVGIFALDPAGEWAELRAASSEGGKRMLARRHRLRVGQEGLIGHVTAHGEPHVTADVNTDPLYYENPDLPETRSEITVPLRSQGRIVGALDIQERSPGAFQDEDVGAIQALADLIAVAQESGRLVGQLQQSVAAERRSYAQLSAQAWLERARATRDIAYRYEQGKVVRLTEAGVQAGESDQEEAAASGKRSWPLGVRGRSIGSVEAHKRAGHGEWSLAERELMQTVIEQLGAALESARLYEDAQLRASGDRLVSDVTGRIRETLDLDTVLRTVAEEVYDALELDEIVVHLVPPGLGKDLRSEG